MSKPRVLFISTPRAVGGGEIYLSNVLPLIKEEFACTVLGTAPIRKLLKGDARTHRIILFPKIIQKLIKRNYRLKKMYYKVYFKIYLSIFHYDVINLQEFDGVFVEAIGFRPILLTEQTRLFVSPHLKDWARDCLNGLDKIVCVSQQTLDDVTGLGVDKDKCLIIHNGVDIDKHSNSDMKLSKYIDWVGRIEEKDKNPFLFILIAEAAQAQGKDYQFRMIGSGSALKKINKYIAKHGIKNIQLLGYIPRSKMLDIYKETKLLCMTSRTEGLPFVALEAMACGKPVVSTNVGGMSEIITSRSCGRLIDEPDEWRFFDEIDAIMSSDSEYEKLSRAARKQVIDNFSLASQADQLTSVLEALTKND